MAESLNNQSSLLWLKLAGLNWLGATVKAGLIKEFKTPERVFSASKFELARVQGWDNQRLERFCREGAEAAPVCSLDALSHRGISMVTYNDERYPPLLREIPDSPVVLFTIGDSNLNGAPAIAIVGARKGTHLGFDIALDFAKKLANAGFVIVSGLALGVDTYAHRGAVEAGGRTMAILANGPDVIYPKANQKIRKSILDNHGALLSEYPPGTIARPWHFPVRNRLISGMCVGTLVIEASARSGSLYTARFAGEQNREVFAVPGSIRSKVSEGTLALIQDGANLVTEPEEIIEYFSDILPEKDKDGNLTNTFINDLTKEEKKIIGVLENESLSLDSLIEKEICEKERLFSLLLTLEMRDYLIKLPGNRYQAKLKLGAEREL